LALQLEALLNVKMGPMKGGSAPIRRPCVESHAELRHLNKHCTTRAITHLISELLERSGMVAQPGRKWLQSVNLHSVKMLFADHTMLPLNENWLLVVDIG
jgi:hypothetical protein